VNTAAFHRESRFPYLISVLFAGIVDLNSEARMPADFENPNRNVMRQFDKSIVSLSLRY
jgi:hypothetical protein